MSAYFNFAEFSFDEHKHVKYYEILNCIEAFMKGQIGLTINFLLNEFLQFLPKLAVTFAVDIVFSFYTVMLFVEFLFLSSNQHVADFQMMVVKKILKHRRDFRYTNSWCTKDFRRDYTYHKDNKSNAAIKYFIQKHNKKLRQESWGVSQEL